MKNEIRKYFSIEIPSFYCFKRSIIQKQANKQNKSLFFCVQYSSKTLIVQSTVKGYIAPAISRHDICISNSLYEMMTNKNVIN